jgi:antitoxin (DNA-binding transcriptional repressor) of toxin-antitoxin stability system
MRTINIRQLRDTRQLESWLEEGETIRLLKRRRQLADIIPISKPRRKKSGGPTSGLV